MSPLSAPGSILVQPPLPAAPEVARATPGDVRPGLLGVLRACLEMTKARLSAMVAVTAGAGFLLAGHAAPAWGPLGWTLLGTLLSAFGANAFNQCLESGRDGTMDRTCGRPLPSGRVSPAQGVVWAATLVGSGVVLLAASGGLLAASLALLVAVLYVAAYTPLKPRTSLNTLVGAVCGAIPPLIGWSAATGGRLEGGAWLLFAILFVWQIPHFLAIDWFHRDDYSRGGFRMASSVDPSGDFSGHLAVLYCLALIPISLLGPAVGLGGWLYFVGAAALGMGLLALSVALWVTRTRAAARRLFLGSLVYLPLLLALMVVDPTR